MYLTYLDANTWLIELAGQRILLDPWLVGPLEFGGQRWFFTGTRTIPREIPPAIDLILLSQGLPDHAHPPTLQQLDRQIPVVASPSAAAVVQDLGYQTITALLPGETFIWNQQIKIQAFPGSPIGPFQVENAFVLTDLVNATSLYYEPHGFHAPELKNLGKVDVAMTPLSNINLPLLGPFIKGGKHALQLVQWLTPHYIVPTTTIGNVNYGGVLSRVLTSEGSLDGFSQLLKAQELDTQLLNIPGGERLEIPVPAAASR